MHLGNLVPAFPDRASHVRVCCVPALASCALLGSLQRVVAPAALVLHARDLQYYVRGCSWAVRSDALALQELADRRGSDWPRQGTIGVDAEAAESVHVQVAKAVSVNAEGGIHDLVADSANLRGWVGL